MSKHGLLILTSNFAPAIGGAPSALRGLGSRLTRLGVPVTVWTPRQQPDWPAAETIEGIEVRRFRRPTTSRLGPFRFDATIARELFVTSSSFRWILLNSVGNHTATALMVARAKRKPTLIRLQSSGPRSDFRLASRNRGGWLTTRICARADGYIASSTLVQDDLVEQGIDPERIHHIPNGVNHVQFAPLSHETPTQPSRMVYLGRLVPVKRVDMLLKAWNLTMKRLAPGSCVLEIHGDGPQRGELENLAGELEIEDSVKFCGFAANAASVLRGASGFVLCSALEGMSNSLLEAMACGLPVVSTAISGSTDLIRHEKSGLLVDGDAVEPLAEAMARVLQDHELATRLGSQARHTIEAGFTLEHLADRYLQVLESLG